MKKQFFLLAYLLLFSFLSALQWPVDEPVLNETFGTPHDSRLGVGISLESNNLSIKPYKAGELIFWAPHSYGPNEEDGVIVILHEDGFRSSYGRMKPAVNTENRSFFKEEDLLGHIRHGTVNDTLLFAIRDSRLNLWVNPLFMFTSMQDDIPPQIEGVYLEEGGSRIELKGSQKIPARSYRLLIHCIDKITKDGLIMYPHGVKVRYLGTVIYSLSLDSLSSREGQYNFEGSVLNGSPFTSEGYIDAGTLDVIGGKGFLELEVTDYRGNRTIRQFPINQE